MTDLSDQVSGAVREGAREVKEQASNVTESAKGLASQAGEKLLSSVEEQKAAGADFVSGVAGAIRRAATEFDKDVPQAAQYIRLAADQIGTVSDAFRRRDLNQLVADVQGFARRQPTAFLGAVLAGFAAVRLALLCMGLFFKIFVTPWVGDHPPDGDATGMAASVSALVMLVNPAQGFVGLLGLSCFDQRWMASSFSCLPTFLRMKLDWLHSEYKASQCDQVLE
jgi:hypothetical protein